MEIQSRTEIWLEALNNVELLESMYPAELIVTQNSSHWLELLKSLQPELEAGQSSINALATLPEELRFLLDVLIEEKQKSLQVEIRLPLVQKMEGRRLGLKQPDWLSRGQLVSLEQSLPEEVTGSDALIDNVFALLNYLQQAVPLLLAEAPSLAKKIKDSGLTIEGDEVGMDRVWFWFPSLSTKEKRNDIVNNAPRYRLTGFVLAGKPGILCLEGTSSNIDGYMAWIKAVSWSDIPSNNSEYDQYICSLG